MEIGPAWKAMCRLRAARCRSRCRSCCLCVLLGNVKVIMGWWWSIHACIYVSQRFGDHRTSPSTLVARPAYLCGLPRWYHSPAGPCHRGPPSHRDHCLRVSKASQRNDEVRHCLPMVRAPRAVAPVTTITVVVSVAVALFIPARRVVPRAAARGRRAAAARRTAAVTVATGVEAPRCRRRGACPLRCQHCQ